MNVMWIVIGNRSYAKIFKSQGMGRHIEEIHHIDNPEGRKKGSELTSDRPGRTFDRFGTGRHALSDESDVHAHEQRVFLGKLTELLEAGLTANSFQELAIICPAQFLGELTPHLSENIRKTISKEVHKDLPLYLSENERVEQICKYLDLWNRATTP